MNRTSPFSSIASVAGAVIILILAFSFDNAIDYLKVFNGRTFAFTPILLWVYPLSDLVLAICLLSLFRYINSCSTIHSFIYIILLVIGLLVLLYLPMASLFVNVLPLSALLTLKMKLIYSGGFIAITGLFGILHKGGANAKRTLSNA